MCPRWSEERRQRVSRRAGGEKSPTEGGSEERGQDLRWKEWRARTSGFGRSGAEKGVKESSGWKESSFSDSHNYLCSSQFGPSPPTYLLSTSFQMFTLFLCSPFISFSSLVFTRTNMHADGQKRHEQKEKTEWNVIGREEWKEWKLKSQKENYRRAF